METTRTWVLIYLIILSLGTFSALIIGAIGSTHHPETGDAGAVGPQGNPGRSGLKYTRASDGIVGFRPANGSKYAVPLYFSTVDDLGNTDDLIWGASSFLCVKSGVFQISAEIKVFITPDPGNPVTSISIFSDILVNNIPQNSCASHSITLTMTTIEETINPVIIVPLNAVDQCITRCHVSADLQSHDSLKFIHIQPMKINIVRISD